MRSKILSMKQKNGFSKKNHAVILCSICLVKNVRLATVSENLTSSLKNSVFYNWLINNILYLCVPSFWGTQKIF